MDSEDRRVPFDELLDDVFAHLCIEVHQTQTGTTTDQVADLGVSIFNACQQLGQDIVREAVGVGCVVEFTSECLEQGLFISGVEAKQEQKLCDLAAVIWIVHPANRQLVGIIIVGIPVIDPDFCVGKDDVER